MMHQNEMNEDRSKPRVVDIALQAGVSTATVDRVLNGRPGVKAKTVQKVREAEDWLVKGGGRPMVVAPKPLGLKIDVLLSGGPGFENEILMREFTRAGRDMGVALSKKFIPRASAVELKAAEARPLPRTVALGGAWPLASCVHDAGH